MPLLASMRALAAEASLSMPSRRKVLSPLNWDWGALVFVFAASCALLRLASSLAAAAERHREGQRETHQSGRWVVGWGCMCRAAAAVPVSCRLLFAIETVPSSMRIILLRMRGIGILVLVLVLAMPVGGLPVIKIGICILGFLFTFVIIFFLLLLSGGSFFSLSFTLVLPCSFLLCMSSLLAFCVIASVAVSVARVLVLVLIVTAGVLLTREASPASSSGVPILG